MSRIIEPWVVRLARTAYVEGMREAAVSGIGRQLNTKEDERLVEIAHRSFAFWWDKTADSIQIDEP